MSKMKEIIIRYLKMCSGDMFPLKTNGFHAPLDDHLDGKEQKSSLSLMINRKTGKCTQ